jgi:PAS domain S-box-containing protein
MADHPPAFLTGGGTTGELIRAFDWSATSLGAPSGWPQSLKTAVSLLLRARQPTFIGWGADQISFYNDGYIPICGTKHPQALGRPMSQVWSEIWHELGPLNASVMRGESHWFENRPFHLAGRERDSASYFSFSYTPLLDDDGRVGGLFCSAIETTHAMNLAARERAEETGRHAVLMHEEQLRLATDAAEIAFWDVSIEANTMIWPARLRRMFGILDDAPLTLEDFYRGLHPEDREAATAAFAAACDPGQRALYDIEYRTVGRDDAQVRWVAAKGRGLFDATGRCVRALGIAVDITARKASEQAMEVALAASRTGTFHWDIQDNTLWWDTALDRLFGLRPGEAVRSLAAFVSLVHPDDRAEVIRRCERCRDFADDFDMEFRVVHPDGSVRWLYDRGRTFLDATGRAKTMTGACVDITELWEAREALRRADRQKDEFLATLAHELRNPLAPLRTGLEVMRRTGLPDSLDKVRGIMARQLDHMVRLVDELLDVARIEQGKMVLRRDVVSLNEVLREAVEGCRPAIDAAGITLEREEIDEGWQVDGDATRLVQVVGNLLNNAAKYTPRGGRVVLRAFDEGELLRIEVEDTGIGIPVHSLGQVFERFVQVQEHRERAQGGLGIGLSLVKSLVELHGGRVAAHSEGEGKGSRFVVWLPRAGAGRGVDAPPAAAIAPLRTLKVLVVDDNRDAADTLALMLTQEGHEVQVANDGAAALEIAVQHQPAIVFLDLGMPGMNGYQTARQMRVQAGGAKRVLVALTGWGADEDRARSVEAGFDTHMTKPVDTGRLWEALALATRQAGGESEARA